ncbi:hypothetical protein S7711_06258 [Stachybotrys chartarum IBT 7711]|uniref:Uncharacterized protein n=1 Tax=Stachybotrys chartarum (strain CBS 109288 / IBT 7711) TaxID=1280523 RepID=A0A084B4Z4_STACB|nr:hypothetical protein S7711_06258 [Stachybotrys chartarum IBT 7711]
MSSFIPLPFVLAVPALNFLLSIPAWVAVTAQLRQGRPMDRFYEDSDGSSTPEAIARFSNRRAKAAIVIFAILGFVASIAILILSILPTAENAQQLEAKVFLAAWGIVLGHCFCIVAQPSSTKAHTLGTWLLCSALVLAVALIEQLANPSTLHGLNGSLYISNTFSSLGLGISCSLLPRRPVVIFKKHEVDNQWSVSLMSRLTWSWIQPLILQASASNDLNLDQIHCPDHSLRSEELQMQWVGRQDCTNHLSSIWRTYRGRIVLLWAMTTLRSLVGVVPFWAMLRTISILEAGENASSNRLHLLTLIFTMAISNLLDAWMEGWAYWYSVSALSLPMRSQLSSLIFSKSLRRKNIQATDVASKRKQSSQSGSAINPSKYGEQRSAKQSSSLTSRQATVNLVGVDTERIAYFFQFQFLILNGILKLALFSTFLLRLIGWVPLISGIFAWTVILPASACFSNMILLQSDKLMRQRDEKLAKLNEALLGVRQIKFSASEHVWESAILALREAELKTLWRYFLADSALFGCWVVGPILLAATSLSVYVVVNGDLSASVAFVTVGVFSALETTLGSLPELLTLGIDTLVSIDRIGTYLRLPEQQPTGDLGLCITFERASVAWPEDEATEDRGSFILRDLCVSFPEEALSVISGKTGSGKSLLISAILGEADLIEGSINVPKVEVPDQLLVVDPEDWAIPGLLAYVGQSPWLENNSLRDNILFGLPFVNERYTEVVRVCALTQDFAILPDGDCTELGANGVNLSGGQKWRVALARAVYSRAKTLIFEDIFSAVDAHVAHWIFEQCLVGNICKGRTRIIATHRLDLVLPKADFFVELAGGEINYSGPPHRSSVEACMPDPQMTRQLATSAQALPATDNAALASNSNGQELSSVNTTKSFMQEEARVKGAVKSKVYSAYLTSSSLILWGVCMAVFLAYQIVIVGQAWWLRIWVKHHEVDNPHTFEAVETLSTFKLPYTQQRIPQQSSLALNAPDALSQSGVFYYLSVYILLSVATAALGILRCFWIYYLAIKSSTALFQKMVFTVLRLPLHWLNTVPTGRIVNRFTSDFNAVDQRVPLSLIRFLTNSLKLAGICVACFFTSAYLIPPAMILVLLGVLIGKRYLVTSRPLKRLESNSKSPVFDLFNTTLTGITTIRAFGRTEAYLSKMHGCLNEWTMTTFYTALANRWMSFRMALIASCFCIAVGMVIVFNRDIDAALAGFALSFVLDFSESIRWAIRCYGDMELDMNSMERINDYMCLEIETICGDKPPVTWPRSGIIELKNIEAAYSADSPLVLRGLSFKIQHRERIGVVGRTGAGKSSLALALFRFLEVREGIITIDGVDISAVNLHELRSRLFMIPQDPILFSGTIRSNLDPLEKHTDGEILEALERVQLIKARRGSNGDHDTVIHEVGNIFYNLSSPVSESGGNVSHGQRQLMCIARAILASPKVIIFDEATSAVDVATEELVQDSIRDGFKDATVIVIAHRLSTVANLDKIMVLDSGRMVEFGTPRELWEKGGSFRSMCERTSKTEREELRNTFMNF